jgi:3'(2'), 5'-bisphosphate nucleotidase
MMSLAAWREPLVALARDAGAAIMRVYAQDFAVETKDDDSPLTAADLAAHRIIVAGLAALTPDIPVLSEEAAEIPWATRRTWSRLWVVDPLDGTREFVKRNGEFTVNIALVEDGAPVLGVVHAPALDYLVHGERGVGAFLREGGVDVAIGTQRPASAPLRVAASRSHLDDRTRRALERIGEHERLGLGSSLKFCRIAEGRVDFYPRFGPTS